MSGHQHIKANLLTGDELDDVIRAMARAIAADVAEPPLLIGIKRRGVPLARRLASALAELGAPDRPPTVGAIGITRYTDELELVPGGMRIEAPEVEGSYTGRPVVLIDDVFYTGWTFLEAITAVLKHGAPSRLATAVLVRRAGETVPVATRFVGRTFEIGARDIISVRLREIDGSDGVDLATTSARG